jgi:penicillin-binding protein 1C
LKLPSRKYLTPLLAAALVLAGLRLWPHAPLEQAVTSSRVVLADDGSLLRMTLADDGQYRLWLPLERISPSLVEALLLKEDRNFYWHPGINPPALLRAALATYSGGQRQGGST